MASVHQPQALYASDSCTAQLPFLALALQERKDLVAGGYRDKHFWWGSVLLGGGILIAVEGALNTWFRTGKLFPGPHLFAGAGIVVLWALAAALVPQMQKGNEGARNAHIALNAVNLALFAWQVCGLLRFDVAKSCTCVRTLVSTTYVHVEQHVSEHCGCVAETCSCLTTQDTAAVTAHHPTEAALLAFVTAGSTCSCRPHLQALPCSPTSCLLSSAAMTCSAAAALCAAAGAHWPRDCWQGV
jgi:hypothetical protein